MDATLLAGVLAKNKPVRIETAFGRVFEVPHQDYVGWSPKRTTVSIFYEENGEEHIAVVPLLTVTAVITKN